MDDLQTKLIEYLQDAQSMEQSVKRMLDSIVTSSTDPEVRAIFERHQAETECHEVDIARRLSELGAGASTVSEVGAASGALIKGLADQLRDDQPGRDARDAYATEHFEIAVYELLERLAVQAGDVRTAEIARRNCADERRMAASIDRIWDRVLVLSMTDGAEATADQAA